MNTETIQHAAACAVVAWVTANHLTNHGEVLDRYGRWLDRQYDAGRQWLAKPLGYCARCFAGQLALWSGFFALADQYQYHPIRAALCHIVTICAAIFFTVIFDKLKD